MDEIFSFMDKDSISVDAFAVLENDDFQRLNLTLKKPLATRSRYRDRWMLEKTGHCIKASKNSLTYLVLDLKGVSEQDQISAIV